MNEDRRVSGFRNQFGFGPSDRAEQRPLLLRVVCVADFLGAATGPSPGVQAVDAHELDAVMARLKPRLFTEVAGHLGSRTLAADITFESLKDFEPRRAALRVPALAAVQQFVDQVAELQSGALTPIQFKQDLARFAAAPALAPVLNELLDIMGGPAHAADPAPEAPATEAVDSAIASIFRMVDAGPSPAAGTGSAVDAAGAAIAGGGRWNLAGPLGRARDLLEAQLAEIVAHPQWRALEAAWRGLHLLCRHGKGARLELLHATPDDVIETLQTYVVQPDRDGAGAPVSLVLCDLPLANRPADIARIQQLGDTGQELQAPVVIALDAGFLGVESLASLAARDNPAGLFQAGSFDAWRSLRDKECARWLVAAVNGFAARAPRKGAAMPAPGDVLWASPVWLVGAAVARAQARTGWPAAHAGLADGEIESLPVFDVSGRDSQYPLQALFPENAIRQLARAGLTPLLAQPNHDSAWVVAAPVLRRPSRAEEEGKMNTLAWALVAARLGAAAGQASRHLAAPGDPERTRQRLEQYLQDLLSDTGAGAAAEVSLDRDVLQVQLRVGRDILGGLEFTFTLPAR